MRQPPKEQKFLLDEFWISAWNASVQRAGIYKKNSLPTPERRSFRSDLENLINSKLLPQYRVGCSEAKHYINISILIELGAASGKNVLSHRGYGYGIAQKLLNLYLKYCWCAGYIAEPPHCPIDRIIIGKTSIRDKRNWTRMNETEYREVMKEIVGLARLQGLTPARWELENYQRR
jgi:hypothetical protein